MGAIAIDGLFNARATGAGAPWLVRTGAPDTITAAGITALRQELGVSVIVDLREPSEAGAAVREIPVRSVPLYGAPPPQSGRLEDVYERLLRERGGALASAVGAVAEADGAALVHCTAGKDRTGLVVALARLVAGESRERVVSDYVLSAPEVRAVREEHALEMARTLPDAMRLHLESPREAIEHAFAVIDQLGGPERYLLRFGLRDRHLAALRRKHEAAA